MKAQFVYENMRFRRGKDPKSTMNIGRYKNYEKHLVFSSEEEATETLIELIPLILDTDEIPEDIISYPGVYIRYDIFKKLMDYVDKYFKGIGLMNLVDVLHTYLIKMGFSQEKNYLEENMRFERGEDPYKNLNIGVKRYLEPIIGINIPPNKKITDKEEIKEYLRKNLKREARETYDAIINNDYNYDTFGVEYPGGSGSSFLRIVNWGIPGFIIDDEIFLTGVPGIAGENPIKN